MDAVARAVACCGALNKSGLLRVDVSPRSTAGLRLRDIAGAKQPLDLVVYWGVWHEEADAGRALLAALSRLAGIAHFALDVTARVQIVLTDTHAQLNGVSEDLIDRAERRLTDHLPPATQLHKLSSLLGTGALAPDAASALCVPGMARLHQLLHIQAGKLFPAELAAERAWQYLLANLREAPYVAARWPFGLFVHIGPAELKLMLPSLPMLHSYAGPEGQTRKPWFV